jgi:FtsZ-binding cell division protein ZapB
LLVTTPSMLACVRIRGTQVVQATTAPRSFEHDAVAAVEAAGRLAGKKLGPVWILSTDLWCQPMSVPAEVGVRIPAPQLPRFLSFEAEPLSGLSPQEAQSAAVSLEHISEQSNYWYLQTPTSQFDAWEGRIAALGGKLQGVAHPAGLPGPVSNEHGRVTSWQRLEVWPEMAVCLHAEPNRAPRVHLIPTTVGSNEWRAQADRWFESQGRAIHREILALDRYSLPQPDAAAPIGPAFDAFDKPPAETNGWDAAVTLSLDDDAARGDWLAQWAAALGRYRERGATFPMLRPVAKPMDARTRRTVTLGLGALTLLACMGHSHWTETTNTSEAARLKQEIAQLQAPAKEMQQVKKSIQETQQQRDALASRNQSVARQLTASQRIIEAYRGRMAGLLESLATHGGGQIVVHAITQENDGLTITGRCLEQRQASQLAKAIAREMAPLGLHVTLPSITATYALPSGGPFEFVLEIGNGSATQMPAADIPEITRR